MVVSIAAVVATLVTIVGLIDSSHKFVWINLQLLLHYFNMPHMPGHVLDNLVDQVLNTRAPVTGAAAGTAGNPVTIPPGQQPPVDGLGTQNMDVELTPEQLELQRVRNVANGGNIPNLITDPNFNWSTGDMEQVILPKIEADDPSPCAVSCQRQEENCAILRQRVAAFLKQKGCPSVVRKYKTYKSSAAPKASCGCGN